MDDAIRFQAQVFKVQTLQTGGGRLTLDFPDISLMGKFAEAQQPGIILECAAVAVNIEKQQENNAIREGKERKSYWQASEG